MIKKMIKHGNSAALIIDKPIMELLELDIDKPVKITTDGKSLIISPISEGGRSDKFERSIDKINKRHQKTLEKLAR